MAGQAVVKHAGREHGVLWTTCDKCGTVRQFAGGVPEELGGSTGWIEHGEPHGARSAA